MFTKSTIISDRHELTTVSYLTNVSNLREVSRRLSLLFYVYCDNFDELVCNNIVCIMLRRRATNEQTVNPFTATTSTNPANRSSPINFRETDELDYRRLTAVVMTVLRDKSTASVAVDVVALIGCKQEEMVRLVDFEALNEAKLTCSNKSVKFSSKIHI